MRIHRLAFLIIFTTLSRAEVTEPALILRNDRLFGSAVLVDSSPNYVSYIYLYDIETLEFIGRVQAADAASNVFGSIICMNDRYLFASDPRAGIKESINVGCVYIFDLQSRLQISKLFLEEVEESDEFGSAMVADDQFLFVGFGRSTVRGVFKIELNPLRLYQIFYPENFEDLRGFGCHLAIAGNFLVVGHEDEYDAPGPVFVVDSTDGSLIHRFLPDDAWTHGAGNDFGASGFAISKKYGVLAIGAHSDSQSGYRSGAIYTFDLVTGSLLQKIRRVEE